MKDRQKLSVLIVLLLVLALVLVMGYRMNRPATTAAVEVAAAQAASNLPATTDGARIRLDLVEKNPDAGEKAGDKNIFAYRQAPPPPAPASRSGIPNGFVPVPAASPPANVTPPTPPPPPIPLKFEGFAVVNSGSGELRAFLSDQSRRYTVVVGEFLMGRYRITRISETSVEVEDLEYNRRQTLPLVK